jgi:hypothetical protein
MQSDREISVTSSSAGPQQQPQQNTRALKQSFSSLVDSMRFAYQKADVESKIGEIEAAAKKATDSLDSLNLKLVSLTQSLSDSVDPAIVKELSGQLSGFSELAIEQTKDKLSEKTAIELGQSRATLESVSMKTRKSLEAFIATAPFPVLDKVINVKLVDGAYEARGVYKCAESILYEFSYDTKKSRMLNKEFRLSMFAKDLKIPTSVGKTWLRKDQVPDYERADQYALRSAESSENSLIVVFEHEEKSSRLKMVYSKHDSHSTLSVEFSDPQKTVDVTGTPSLNRFLDADPLEKMTERLWLAIIDLENYKSELTKLVCDGQDTLQDLNCFPFFARSWKVLSPRVVQEIEKSEAKDGTEVDDSMSRSFVVDKVSLLGADAQSVLETLGLKN